MCFIRDDHLPLGNDNKPNYSATFRARYLLCPYTYRVRVIGYEIQKSKDMQHVVRWIIKAPVICYKL